LIAPIRVEEAAGPSFLEVEFGVSNTGANGKRSARKNLVFVIMAFGGSESQETYAAIQEECSKQGLKAVRVDENVSSGFIIKDILELIERAEFIICGLSNERPNVYYELGYAHGVGNHSSNIFLTARDGTRLHFDIAPLRVHYYQSIDHLRALMVTSFIKLVEAKRKRRGSSRSRGSRISLDNDL
jgi:hypothetical protein